VIAAAVISFSCAFMVLWFYVFGYGLHSFGRQPHCQRRRVLSTALVCEGANLRCAEQFPGVRVKDCASDQSPLTVVGHRVPHLRGAWGHVPQVWKACRRASNRGHFCATRAHTDCV